MRSTVAAAALLLPLSVALGGTATFLDTERTVSAVGAGDLGLGCVTVPVGDDTDRFGPFFSTTGVPLFTSGSASQLSSLTPSALVFGNGQVTLVGTPECDGNAVASTIDLRFLVEGQLLVLLEGSLSASGSAGVASTAAAIIETEGGAVVYEASATAGGDQPSADASLEGSLVLTAGTYRLRVFATAQDVVLGETMTAQASYDVSISFPAVANDECASAEPVEIDGFAVFDTTNATTDGPAEPGCFGGEGGSDQIEGDVWYVYESACDAWLILTTCGLADFDTRMAVYAGCPDVGGTLVACNDDAPDCFGGTSQILVPVYSGITYFVRIGGADGARGAGGLLVTCEVPNDYCGDVLQVDLGEVAFSTVGATTDGPPLAGGCAVEGDDQIHNDIWFEVVADCTGTLHATACGSADFETRVAIYAEPCPSDDTSRLACAAAGPDCGEGTGAVALVVKGSSYFIRLGGASVEVEGRLVGLSGHGTLSLSCVACPADIDGSGVVDGADLGQLLAAWGQDTPAVDLNGDGVVEGGDLGVLLSAWGACG